MINSKMLTSYSHIVLIFILCYKVAEKLIITHSPKGNV